MLYIAFLKLLQSQCRKSDPHYSKKYLRTALNVCAHEHRLHSELCYLDIDILT